MTVDFWGQYWYLCVYTNYISANISSFFYVKTNSKQSFLTTIHPSIPFFFNCDHNIYEWDILQLRNKLVSALWWTNCLTETLFLNCFKCIFGISVLQCLVLIGQHIHQYLCCQLTLAWMICWSSSPLNKILQNVLCSLS